MLWIESIGEWLRGWRDPREQVADGLRPLLALVA